MSIKEGLNRLRKKPKYHHMQETRKENLQKIMGWDEAQGEHPNRKILLRKTMIVIGCTRSTAIEYLSVILDEEDGA